MGVRHARSKASTCRRHPIQPTGAAPEKLGGALVLQQLRDAHREYGEALGITVEGQEVATAGVREPLNEFTDALRAYVLAVAAHADPKDEVSIELTNALLAPLYRWQTYIAVSNAPEPTPPGPTPPGPTPPGPTTNPVPTTQTTPNPTGQTTQGTTVQTGGTQVATPPVSTSAGNGR